MKKIYLILKVFGTRQTGVDDYQDDTRFETVAAAVGDDVYEKLMVSRSGQPRAVVLGALQPKEGGEND